jgi:dihydropteroate synthase
VASILQRASDTNAHPIDISSAGDLKRHLGEIDIADGDIEGTADQFLYSTIKLEGVDTRAANLMKTCIETLGGALAMRKEAEEFTVRETDIIVSGSRRTLSLLVTRLRGEPFGLDGIAAEIEACISSGARLMSWACWILRARPT